MQRLIMVFEDGTLAFSGTATVLPSMRLGDPDWLERNVLELQPGDIVNFPVYGPSRLESSMLVAQALQG